MNESEVEHQIDQMVKFIVQEAEEKANEIGVSAEEEFNIEKLQLLESEKAKIRKDFERREGQVDVKKKIEYSKQLNESRIKVLQAQEDALQGILKDAEAGLAKISKDKKKYKALLTDLIVQASYKLQEKAVTICTRQEDAKLVNEAMEAAKGRFKSEFGSEAPAMTLDDSESLPSSQANDDEATSCTGGVVVASASGLIKCNNTLDDRLRIAYTQTLPDIRTTLFGQVTRA